jgi:hypothetical protein
MNLKNQIEINISLLTNEYNLKQITKTNLSVYDIKTIEELDLLEEENDNNKNTPDYVFLSKYYELTMLFYNEIYSLPKKLAKFIENNILKNNNSNNGYKISKMDNHSLIQTEFINLVKELNNKIGNLSQYIETIKKDINDGKIKNKLINLFRGYIIPIEYKENKTSRYTFDMDNFENNYILINIISDYCELKFSSGDKYYKNFEIKIINDTELIMLLKSIREYYHKYYIEKNNNYLQKIFGIFTVKFNFYKINLIIIEKNNDENNQIVPNSNININDKKEIKDTILFLMSTNKINYEFKNNKIWNWFKFNKRWIKDENKNIFNIDSKIYGDKIYKSTYNNII